MPNDVTPPWIPKEEVAVEEYQAAQRFVNYVGQVMWQSQSVLIGAALAGAAVALTLTPRLTNVIGLSVFAAGVIALLEIARLIWVRHLSTLEITWTRMREIESATGMRRNIYLDILRRWDEREQLTKYRAILDESEWSHLEDSYPKYGSQRVSNIVSNVVGRIIEAGWIALAIGKWLDYAT